MPASLLSESLPAEFLQTSMFELVLSDFDGSGNQNGPEPIYPFLPMEVPLPDEENG